MKKMNFEDIKKLPDDSITDSETIRQISIYSLKTGDNLILNKIKKEFMFAGLYPKIMQTYNYKSDKIENFSLNK